MQAGVHLQLLVGAVGMERKMNSSVGLGRRWRHRWVGREYLETTLSKPRGKLDTATYRDWHERLELLGSKTARECIQSIQDHQHFLDLDLKAVTSATCSHSFLKQRTSLTGRTHAASLVPPLIARL